MGQKVNPIGLRIGIIREWDAKWYAPKTKVADLLHEDLKIRKFLNTFINLHMFHVLKQNVQVKE